MKRRFKRGARRRWWIAWIIQVVIMGVLCLLTAAAYGVHPTVYGVLLWAVVPLAGADSAFRAVQRGLLNYAAWIAPPACLFLTHYAMWGYSPSAGAALLCAFVSLVGAAAGEVFVQRYRSAQSSHRNESK